VIKKFSRDDFIYFGKYKGDTVAKIAVENPSYLLWANKIVDGFKLDDDALKYVNEMMELTSAHSKRNIRVGYLDDYEDDIDDRFWSPSY
jgi:hypothetical protein